MWLENGSWKISKRSMENGGKTWETAADSFFIFIHEKMKQKSFGK